jgi:DNA-binding CsgD family transcriptional regulator
MQIGRRLGIAQRTVGKHLENIYRKTQTTNRTEAAAQLGSLRVLPPVPSDTFADTPVERAGS